jgi:hypothetical protein
METVNHWSDCAQHNEPATPNGECDCGGDAPSADAMDDKVDFAKVFKTGDVGQILVVIDDGEKGPEVQFSFVPDGLGVCRQAIQFDGDIDTAWDSAQELFDSVDEARAVEIIQPTLNMLRNG